MYHDIIRKARLEADALLALLEEDSKTYCECNDDLNGIENNKPFVFTFLGASFVSNQRTIFLLSEIDPRSHEFWGPWWKYKFHVHGTSELTSDHYELAKLSYSVAVREDGTADQLQGVAKVMLDEWDGRFDERKQYIIGLSSMEQELLSLNPMAKYVNPWEPEFNMALAFD
jgi:hypothetical protein